MSTVSILICGRLGDFFYSLCVPKYIYETLNKKSNIFICESGEGFRLGLKETYADLKNIMYGQPYVNKFKIYKHEKIDIDMTTWRKGKPDHADWLRARGNKLTWNEFYFKLYLNNTTPTQELTNISSFKKISKYKDWLIINRVRYLPTRASKFKDRPSSFYNEQFNTPQERLHGKSLRDIYLQYIKQYKNVGFIFYDKQQYDEFPLKDEVIPIEAKNLEHMIDIIGSCDKFIGNQSAPLAIAHSLNVKRVVETNIPTAWRYVVNEYKFFNKIELIH